jgi:hypothetical protein
MVGFPLMNSRSYLRLKQAMIKREPTPSIFDIRNFGSFPFFLGGFFVPTRTKRPHRAPLGGASDSALLVMHSTRADLRCTTVWHARTVGGTIVWAGSDVVHNPTFHRHKAGGGSMLPTKSGKDPESFSNRRRISNVQYRISKFWVRECERQKAGARYHCRRSTPSTRSK